jgi:hypothetical protein
MEVKNDVHIHERLEYAKVRVVIEEGAVYDRPNASKVSGLIGEVRGVIVTLAWINGFKVSKMAVASWKALLTKGERKMKKDSAYVAYWDKSLNLDATTPDEIDAFFIAKRAILGRTKN